MVGGNTAGPNDGVLRTAQAFLLGLGLLAVTAAAWFTLTQRTSLDGTMLLLWLNVFLITFGIVLEARRRPYSLHLMHLIAMFLFLGAAALFQYTRGTLGVAGPIAAIRPFVQTAAFAVTLWVVATIPAYELVRFFSAPTVRGPMASLLARPLTYGRSAMMLVLSAITLVYLAGIGMIGVSTRAAALDAFGSTALQAGAGGFTTTFYLVHVWLLRSLSLVALLGGLLLFFKDRSNRNAIMGMMLVVVGAGTFLANNPFAASRMWFVTFAFGFVGPFFLTRLRTGWAVVVISLSGLAVLPALHLNRFAADFQEFVAFFQLASPIDYLSKNSDVDSLGMTALCVKWIDGHGIRGGVQIMGALFAFIPRAIWSSKPTGTGGMVTEDLGFEFTNLSNPFLAEALVDFGMPGVPLLAAAFSALLARLDHVYWRRPLPGEPTGTRIIDCVYPFWLGCVVFITRGDLFASYTQTMAFTVWLIPIAFGVRWARSASAEEPASPSGVIAGS